MRRRRKAVTVPAPFWSIETPAGVEVVQCSFRGAQLAGERALHEYAASVGVKLYAVRINDGELTGSTADGQAFTATVVKVQQEVAA